VLAHRVVIRPDAQARGLTPESVIEDLFAAVPVPAGR
jgi:hypothetical protein